MADILQGTTPSLEIKIDPEDFSVGDVTVLELTFKCGETWTKGLSDVTVDADANSFTYHFTQAETLKLDPRKVLYYQLRFKFQDGSVVGTVKERLNIADLMSEETI